jgi:hypothetical protein
MITGVPELLRCIIKKTFLPIKHHEKFYFDSSNAPKCAKVFGKADFGRRHRVFIGSRSRRAEQQQQTAVEIRGRSRP